LQNDAERFMAVSRQFHDFGRAEADSSVTASKHPRRHAMFTQTHCHAASFDALRTTFRLAEEAQRQGRVAAAFASVLVSVGLLGSVVIGLTSMASPADMSVSTTSAPVTELMARQQVRSPLGPTA